MEKSIGKREKSSTWNDQKTIHKDFDFTFDKLSKDIDPKETIPSKLLAFKLHNMHKMMVSEETNHL